MCRWQAERGHSPAGLAGKPQWLAAGGNDPQVRTVPQQVLGEVCAGLDQVLTVIDKQHDARLTQCLAQRLSQWLIRAFADIE